MAYGITEIRCPNRQRSEHEKDSTIRRKAANRLVLAAGFAVRDISSTLLFGGWINEES